MHTRGLYFNKKDNSLIEEGRVGEENPYSYNIQDLC